MFTYQYGGKSSAPQKLKYSKDKLVARTIAGIDSLDDAVKSEKARELLEQFQVLEDYSLPDVNVFMLENKAPAENRSSIQNRARASLSEEDNLRFAGRVLVEVETGEPVIYTENLFVKFKDSLTSSACKRILKGHDLTLKDYQPEYAKNAYFVAADGRGAEVFHIASELLKRDDVEAAHPELIRRRVNRTPRAVPSNEQWHLGNDQIHLDTVWNDHNIRGEGTIIAIIDDGVEVTHDEFNSDGKVVAPRDVLFNNSRAVPGSLREFHGTNCAGIACATGIKAPGVAPAAKLMPIRLPPGSGSMHEAAAFFWASQNGADVISCSWGPPDGLGLISPLPDSTRLAIDYAIKHGRDGKGCVIVWAAGNGSESVDDDGYASYEPVIAVSAYNNQSVLSSYSDYGRAIWCTFPGGDNQPKNKAHGLYTTTLKNQYTNVFWGTSAACPGIAGIAALILSANPELSHKDIKEILRLTAVKIDDKGGAYVNGHSPKYGYGRPDALAAVELATSMKGVPSGSDGFITEGVQLEAITFTVDTSRYSRAQVKQRLQKEKVLGSGWVFKSVEHSQDAIDALYTRKKQQPTVKEAWELNYRLLEQPEVSYAQPSFLLPVPGETDSSERMAARSLWYCPPDSATDNKFTWALESMKVPEAWDYILTEKTGKPFGEGVLIGHPDSGYRPHRELDFDRLILDNDYDFIDDDDETHEPSANGNHGLSTGSVIMSGRNTKPKPYVNGSAPRASLMPLRVAKQTIFPVPVMVFSGMRRLRRAINHAVDEGCRVISISLGGLPIWNQGVDQAIERAVQEGVIIVAAAGNIVGWVTYPGSDPNVICVAASNIHDNHWRGSCRGPQVDVTAPGELVWRAFIDENDTEAVERSCGTSYSAALTAGVAALWLAHHGYAKLVNDYGKENLPSLFKELLMVSCRTNHNLPTNGYGAGIVDANKTLRAKLPDIPTRRRLRRSAKPMTPLMQISALFEDASPQNVQRSLCSALDVPIRGLSEELAEIGDELLFHLVTNYRFYTDFKAMVDTVSQMRLSRSLRIHARSRLQPTLNREKLSGRLANKLGL